MSQLQTLFFTLTIKECIYIQINGRKKMGNKVVAWRKRQNNRSDHH